MSEPGACWYSTPRTLSFNVLGQLPALAPDIEENPLLVSSDRGSQRSSTVRAADSSTRCRGAADTDLSMVTLRPPGQLQLMSTVTGSAACGALNPPSP